jgi:outer membrane protein assembly factor BamB
MKFQCSCGAHYELEVTPEMAHYPVPFVCGACGVDGSDHVTQLARAELGVATRSVAAQAGSVPVAQALPIESHPAAAPLDPLPGSYMAPPETAAAPRVVRGGTNPAPASRLRVQVETPPPPQSTGAASAVSDEFPRCIKHGEIATEKCYVCHKPICPKCMRLFGYLCSPLCKAKADSHGIDVPVFEGQKSIVEARSWQRTVRIASIAGGVLAVIVVIWGWYRYFGSQPKPAFKTRFENVAYSGESVIAGTNQILFLHGGTLARHDMKQKQEVWSHYIVDKEKIEKSIQDTIKRMKKIIDKANSDDPDYVPKMPDPEEMRTEMTRYEESALQLRVIGQNVWVQSPDKVTQYDWATGKPVKDVWLTNNYATLIRRGNELLLVDERQGKENLTRINLATAEIRTEDLSGHPLGAAAASASAIAAAGGSGDAGGGLPLKPGEADRPLDPAKVRQQASQLSLPGKIALPAVLANSMTQQRTMDEAKDKNSATNNKPQPKEPYLLIPTPDGFIRFSTKLLEEKIVSRAAMKAAPAKSAFEGDVTVSKTADIVNEQLNEWQREHGGDKVWEDESRYRVKLSSADGKDEWTGEVVGEPDIYPLQTVNVLTANKTIIVFDKSNKKLWQAALTYNVVGGREDPEAEDKGTGHGPCVERKGVLYVFDQGVLHAFNLTTGEVRWRVPSVGIESLYFDDHDMIYVTSTDATPERIRYSRQIDIRQQDNSVLMKIDPKNGKQLWSVKPFGQVSYISGKYIYTVSSYRIDNEDGDTFSNLTGLSGTKPHTRIKRLSQSTGKEMWDYYEPRGAVNVEFDKNSIRLVFKREVEVLRFLSL